jgi:hypothetical protein
MILAAVTILFSFNGIWIPIVASVGIVIWWIIVGRSDGSYIDLVPLFIGGVSVILLLITWLIYFIIV